MMRFFTVILLLLFCGHLHSERLEITVVTENFRPYNYQDEGDSLVGPSVEMVRELLTRCGYGDVTINVYPWARAYAEAQRGKNVLIFSMVKTPERDSLFNWVGEVATITMGVFRLRKNSHLKLSSLDDLVNYSITTFIDSPFDNYFSQRGITIKHRVGDYQLLTRILVEGRVDFVPASIEGFLTSAESFGYPRDLFEVALLIPDLNKGLWVAFSKDSDEELVAQFQKEFEKMQSEALLKQ